MNRDEQVSEIFLHACDLPGDQRTAYLDRACADDPPLRAEVESLLEHDHSSSLIESDAFDVISEHPSAEPRHDGIGAMPDHVGRYRMLRVLGSGGYGIVYLAHDEQLERQVAVKLPHRRLVYLRSDAESYRTEARTVAGLDHPNIVPVYDVGSTDEFPCFVVSKYIEGMELSRWIKLDPPSYADTAALVATIAEALHYAHQQGLVHRDIKPGNVLIDRNNQPHIVDFGLALHEENIGTGPRYAGTPAYMSPEQARGEGHRVDGRSDIFSLGGVLYEMLTGHKAFSGDTRSELSEQIISRDVRPLREYDERIPRELERICLKALSKRAIERFLTAKDFADDLHLFLADPNDRQSAIGRSSAATEPAGSESIASAVTMSFSSASETVHDSSTSAGSSTSSSTGSAPIKIVPKGLRSFDEHDADFFLELLPGPRDRNGLPDSLRFWKTKIEETGADKTFAVGLIYGPSGCGKSSLVRAGLLPRLSPTIKPIYVEATAEQTESRLLQSLRKHFPAIDKGLDLKDSLAALRQGQGVVTGNKVLIVLDQFEQWLHANRDEIEQTDLVRAIRQCNGSGVQCIVMVRDDFWMAATSFMSALETPLVEAYNSAAVDLFLPRHARRILKAFGRAYGELPESTQGISKEQQAFVSQSVEGLSEDGKVVCVRLALFAEMVKGKPWTPATLKELGGIEGVGVAFLEETFSAKTAPPSHRYHQQAARAVLKALLPDSATDIKGQMRSREALLEASGYENRDKDFGELINILDSELRLITPTEESSVESLETPVAFKIADDGPSTLHSFYQLTHDYLVPSLKSWLNQKQRETRRGRAELLLDDRSESWRARPENRHLPTWWENANIRLLADKKTWTPSQRRMMKQAARVHGLRFAAIGVLTAMIVLVGVAIRRSGIHATNQTRAETLVESLLTAEIAQVPAIVSELEKLSDWTQPLLAKEMAKTGDSTSAKLHLALAMLPIDGGQVRYLAAQLPRCSLDQFPVVRDALRPHQDQITQPLWKLALASDQEASLRFQAAAALANYSPQSDRWTDIAPLVAEHLTDSVPSAQFGQWLPHLRPVNQQLFNPLLELLSDVQLSDKQRETAANALSDLSRDYPDQICDGILAADTLETLSPLIDALRLHPAQAKNRLLAKLRSPPADEASEEQQAMHLKRKAIAAATLVQLGDADQAWPLLEFSPHPSLRSLVIHYLETLRTDHKLLSERLERESEVSIRRALIQILGSLDTDAAIPPAERDRIGEQLKTLYREDPDPGIHSAASWALRRWAIELPKLIEPAAATEQRMRLGKLSERVETIRQQMEAYLQDELPANRSAWLQQLRETQTPLPTSLSDGLIAHFSMDETEGKQRANSVANQPPAIYDGPGKPAAVKGVLGAAITLDGNGGHLVCEGLFNPEKNDSFSFGCWIFRNNDHSAAILATADSNASNVGVDLWLEQSGTIGIHLVHQWPENAIKVLSNRSLGQKTWHHVFVTYDGSSRADGVTVYIDGQDEPTNIVSDTLTESIRTEQPLHIGMRSAAYPYRGRIDDVRIYHRELAADDVNRLYLDGLRAAAIASLDEPTSQRDDLLIRAHHAQDVRHRSLREELVASQSELFAATMPMDRGWFVNGQGQTMVILQGPADAGKFHIEHRFAISSHEVTIEEYRKFSEPDESKVVDSPASRHADRRAVTRVSWFDAAAYCNWLSDQEGIPESQWIYQRNANDEYADGMKIKENYLALSGYRMPTEAEWIHACRFGTASPYHFGEPISLLSKYAYFILNSQGQVHPVESLLPNDAGLFDLHGNVGEWVQDPTHGQLSPVNKGVTRILRGGAVHSRPESARTSVQFDYPPSARSSTAGFRPVRSLGYGR